MRKTLLKQSLRSLSLCVVLMVSFIASQIANANMLELPIDCEIGKSCFIQKYPDANQGKSYRDYRCGMLTNDGHKGTDFRLMDYDSLNAGVDVFASAAGKVIDVRNYMPDVNADLVDVKSVWNRGYGNMVLIDHGKGLKTLYAHLRRDSIPVKIGDLVRANDILGKVGMSGLTDYPHLHFEILLNNKRIDPFTNRNIETKCGVSAQQSLWKSDIPYHASYLIRLGLFDQRLNRHALEYKIYENARLRTSAKALVLNAYIAGIQKGDKYRVRLFHNNNDTPFYDKEGTYEENKAFAIISGGRKNTGKPWPKGQYRGELIYTRTKDGEEKILFQEDTTTEIK